MKILTWNLGRPETNLSRIPNVQECLLLENADLVILTETSLRVSLGEGYGDPIHTDSLVGQPQCAYKESDRRVSLFSKYPVLRQHHVYDPLTVLCVEVETPLGPLLVYGTIMGILGRGGKQFTEPVAHQLADLKRLSGLGPLCVAGDLNQDFSDEGTYWTREGREMLLAGFDERKLLNLTAEPTGNVDHILLQSDFLKGRQVELTTWNHDKALSDHIGVAVEF